VLVNFVINLFRKLVNILIVLISISYEYQVLLRYRIVQTHPSIIILKLNNNR